MGSSSQRQSFRYGQLEKKGRTVYWLVRTSGIPHVTLWNLSKLSTQRSINLNVLSHVCAALECTPGDLLEFIPDAEDEAIASLVKVKDAATKTAKKKGAWVGKSGVSRKVGEMTTNAGMKAGIKEKSDPKIARKLLLLWDEP
jgi:DNA-binding Xre family transcriptional regulator